MGCSRLALILAATAASGWAAIPVHDDAAFRCRVTAMQPWLGFDLRFHADYMVTVPLKALAGAGGQLQAAVRVTPLADFGQTAELAQRFVLPEFPAELKGEGVLAGGFDVGAGRYRVDWTMRDLHGRVCAARWSLEAGPERRLKAVPLTVKPDTVAERAGSHTNENDAESVPSPRLHIRILLNLSPFHPNQSVLTPADAMLLLAIVRGITEQPSVGVFDLLAFDLRGQKLVYRQDNLSQVDYAGLGKALRASRAGTIDYRLLLDPHGETKFVTQLLTNQLGASASSADAIVIIGPKVWLDKNVSLKSLREGGSAACPIFYLNYNPEPAERWRDTIGLALKAYKTAVAYDLLFPGDLAVAIKDILSRTGQRPASADAVDGAGTLGDRHRGGYSPTEQP